VAKACGRFWQCGWGVRVFYDADDERREVIVRAVRARNQDHWTSMKVVPLGEAKNSLSALRGRCTARTTFWCPPRKAGGAHHRGRGRVLRRLMTSSIPILEDDRDAKARVEDCFSGRDAFR